MSREIKRVPLDFDWPLNQVWEGYVLPESLHTINCASCDGTGLSPRAHHLYNIWYGRTPFKPSDNGSIPLTTATPAVRWFAERNVNGSPDFYGRGEMAIVFEAQRLTNLFNGMWMHHLSQQDIDDMVAEGDIRDLTHHFVTGTGWVPLDPAPVLTPEIVNDYHIRKSFGGGHGYWAISKARAKREGWDTDCSVCDGEGSTEAYPDQSADYDKWKPTEPPEGTGWQIWETVSEGSPISPVFGNRDAFVAYLASDAHIYDTMTYEQADRFVDAGWAPSGAIVNGEIVSGPAFVGGN